MTPSTTILILFLAGVTAAAVGGYYDRQSDTSQKGRWHTVMAAGRVTAIVSMVAGIVLWVEFKAMRQKQLDTGGDAPPCNDASLTSPAEASWEQWDTLTAAQKGQMWNQIIAKHMHRSAGQPPKIQITRQLTPNGDYEVEGCLYI